MIYNGFHTYRYSDTLKFQPVTLSCWSKMVKAGLLFSVLFLTQCASQKKDKNYCERINNTTADYVYKFQVGGDSIYLDSALFWINKALKRCEDQKILIFRKLDILVKQYKFQEAIDMVRESPRPYFKALPYYNAYLENRFEAMNDQLKGDTTARNKNLGKSMRLVGNFIKRNKKEIDSLYKENITNILQTPLHFAPIQYYYCKSLLYGNSIVMRELDSLQKEEGINKAYIEYIKTCMDVNFMDFAGY